MTREHVVVVTTTDSEEAARGLAAAAVEARLGACAQVVGPITSVYRWEGAIETDAEWRVEVKTAGDRAESLVALLTERHTYDVPEVIVTPVVGGHADYLSWLVEETR
ncbi:MULTISPECIES: divalent-cation tolerance protein CutA [Prauserella salsuginis group]|uniref:Periplasmic divalent cation tolerance protein n=2 Tax=Prauserella salsuginis group TaxID=2893672 RepID=A0A839XQQ1_9PSEU|nr:MULTISPECIES: divalent-cation tolerance protein CutA [Prauserella salsuginis group]MBB3666142.1 periplasmic divalent cation tolerance protein [Prauserella sediminis]MCR3722938.1 divalent cation tolerance protein [Prauserella flava]MCR3737387.1 divalent cation tolerance protein [Prauserella salsuginis]